MTDEVMRGLACLVGPTGAIESREFEETFAPALSSERRKYLLRAWLSLEVMPRDASREKDILRDALRKLRDEWQP